MPFLRLDVPSDVYEHLLDQALAERRPVGWQAEVLLRRALGLSAASGQCAAPPSLESEIAASPARG